MQRFSALAVRCLLVFGLALATQARAFAQETVVPAGTLIHCTLEEANFSSASAAVGDPVLCHLSNLVEFGRTVFPRGSYLEGHLEDDKDPGHFVGKGYLLLVFDRIGLPDTDVPVPTKVVAARGYRVDREGDIVGHGHAKRDTAEWLLPPLWPWKVISLPTRGPRPTLKDEEQLTLRLMEDVTVPRMTRGPGWHFFGEDPASSDNRTAPSSTFSDFFWPGGTTGKVKFETSVKNAAVYVDGGYAGTVYQVSPLKLRAGEHDIELRAGDGYLFYQDRVSVIAGKTLNITP